MSGIHTDSARSLVRQLIGTGERLPKELRSDILHLGDAGVAALLEILEDESLAQIDSPGKGWAPIHAAELLGDSRAAIAVEPMLRTFARTDPLDILHDRMLSSLPKIGAPVVEPALRAAASADQETLDSVVSVLSRVGLRDDRILDLLLAQLRRAPGFAGNLAEYGIHVRSPRCSKRWTHSSWTKAGTRSPTTHPSRFAAPSRIWVAR